MPGYVYRVKVLITLYLWYIQKRRVGVSCSVYDMLHTDAKGYIITRKLVKKIVFVASIHSLIKHNFAGIGIRLSIYFATVFYCLLDSAVYRKKG